MIFHFKIIHTATVSTGEESIQCPVRFLSCPDHYVCVTLLLVQDWMMERSAEPDICVTSMSGHVTVTIHPPKIIRQSIKAR